jgi:hypothetical protein
LPETGSNVNIVGRRQESQTRSQETEDRSQAKGLSIKEKG